MVKALDLKSNGNSPCTVEPCSQPSISFFRDIIRKSWEHEPILVFANNWDWRTKDSQLPFLKGVVDRSVWQPPARQSSAKNRTKMHAKISPRTELNSIKIRIMSTGLWWLSESVGLEIQWELPVHGRALLTVFDLSFQRYNQKKLGTRTNTANNWDWRTKDSQSFPGTEQKIEQKCTQKLVHGRN